MERKKSGKKGAEEQRLEFVCSLKGASLVVRDEDKAGGGSIAVHRSSGRNKIVTKA